MLEHTFVAVKGIRTHVTSGGSGTSLVLVHGLGGPLVWQRVFEPLAKEFAFCSIDLPGFGETDCPSHSFSSRDYVFFLHQFLQQQGVQSAILVGVSYGGQIAAEYAERFPELVEKLVLISST